MQQLQTLNSKLEQLLKKYTAVKAENDRLKQTVSQQSGTIDKLNEQLSSLEDSMAEVNSNKAMHTTQDKDGMRKQLDIVIAEIDKILTTLND